MPYGMFRRHQRLARVSLACVTGLYLLACGPTDRAQTEAKMVAAERPRTASQVLPITATAKLAGQVFELEVAKTHQQQTMGLMFRTFLPSNRGMLFPFTPQRSVQFWMKHCILSLDMIFLREGKVVAIAANSPPCKTEPCPVYGPNEPIDQVIEIRGGQTASIGLKVGATVPVQWLKTPR
jgi:uncharacterized protein